MLGIDITDDSIRIVDLRQRGSSFVWQQSRLVPLTPRQRSDPQAMGRLLAESLEQGSLQGQKAVLTLRHPFSFLRRLSPEQFSEVNGSINSNLSRSAIDELFQLAEKSVMIPADQLVFDVWISPRMRRPEMGDSPQGHKAGSILLGAASREVVRIGQEIAHVAGIKMQSLTLRTLAKINALLVHWHDAEEENFAVVVQEGSEVDVGIFDDEGIFSLQTLNLESTDLDQTDQAAELAGELGRIFNTVRLSRQGQGPQRLYLACGDKRLHGDDPFVQTLGSKLNVPVSCCDLQDELLIRKEGHSDEPVMGYAAAIGAMALGLLAVGLAIVGG